jgi:carbamoyl-phosphate synthase large subunit
MQDDKKILMIGPGPVMIGQAGEFDYAMSQACIALKQEGFQTIIVNSNPVTLSSDVEVADKVYIEPLTLENLKKIIVREKPDAFLPIFGGQNALNMAYFLAESGILTQYQIQLLGVSNTVIEKTENRMKFRELMTEMGFKLPDGAIATTVSEGMAIGQRIGLPVVVRASFAMEGAGVMMAYNQEELEEFLETALSLSPIHQVSVEKSCDGFHEFEFELLRDGDGQSIIVTSLENIDPVGVHTGNSAVVIPAQGLTSEDYQNLSEFCREIAGKLGVTGNMNFQFAVNLSDKTIFPIEINPRFTKSTLLAAKATGHPIPVIAAKLAVGFRLAALGLTEGREADVNYTAVKLPCFSFDKFSGADPILGTTIKADGEVLAFGCNFKEAFQKALRSLPGGRNGLGADGKDVDESKLSVWEIKGKLTTPNPERWFYLRYALRRGMSVSELINLSKLSPWFIREIQELGLLEKNLTTYALYNLTPEVLLQAKKCGFSDVQIAHLLRTTDDEVRATRLKKEIRSYFFPIPGTPDGAESYYFSTYAGGPQTDGEQGLKILLVGTGATRITQGTAYDYSLIHAAKAIREKGYTCIMIDCNPASIVTDPMNSGTLYFEPLVKENLLNILDQEKCETAILQFSGKMASPLAAPLRKSGVRILGTDTHNQSTDREYLKKNLESSDLCFPESGIATDIKEMNDLAGKISYPVIARSSSSKSLEVCFNAEDLRIYGERLKDLNQNNPVRIEKYIDDAIGLVVQCIYDGNDFVICGVTEQIEEAGIHPSDSACAIPPYSIGEAVISKIKSLTGLILKTLQVKGCLSIQYAVKHERIYLLTVKTQADSLLPFISKATGVDWSAAAVKVLLGESIKEQALSERVLHHTAIREAVFSFDKFPGADTLLGPSMRSSGEVMGMDADFGMAFIKSQLAAGERTPETGAIYVSIRDEDKRAFLPIARQLIDLGFTIMAGDETADLLNRNNLPCQPVNRVGQGRPNIMDRIKNGEVHWIISINSGRKTTPAEAQIRSSAVRRGIPITTTLSGTQVAVLGLQQVSKNQVSVKTLSEYYN